MAGNDCTGNSKVQGNERALQSFSLIVIVLIFHPRRIRQARTRATKSLELILSTLPLIFGVS
jgi:hypothetical protein